MIILVKSRGIQHAGSGVVFFPGFRSKNFPAENLRKMLRSILLAWMKDSKPEARLAMPMVV